MRLRLILGIVKAGQVNLLGKLACRAKTKFLKGMLCGCRIGEKSEHGGTASAHQGANGSIFQHGILVGLNDRIFLNRDSLQYIAQFAGNLIKVLAADSGQDAVNVRMLLRL